MRRALTWIWGGGLTELEKDLTPAASRCQPVCAVNGNVRSGAVVERRGRERDGRWG